jgi:Domain of unknown function (DUF1844)
MNESTPPADDLLANASREEILSALFANMVIQQTNMAMMLLGKVAHPETGQFIHDLDAAKMFIDQLEMIEVKTKGNLDQREEALLKQALAALRMTFVEAVDAPAPEAKSASASEASPAPAAQPATEAKPSAPPPAEAPSATDESRKKFSKKY